MRIRFLFILIIFVCIIAPGMAQDDGACPALIELALEEVGENCDALNRNTACYGFNRVNASFTESVGDDFFAVPTDRSGLNTLQTIRTAPLDVNSETWGVAAMSVQANIPNTLPGQAVIFLLLGDAEVTNAVPPDEVFESADPVTVHIITVTGNIRSGPGLNTNVVGSVPFDTELEADGQSQDGQWYRIVYEGGPAWVNDIVIDKPEGLVDLPVLNGENYTPMQAFYFNTGLGDPACNEAPDSIIIQGPENIEVTVNANGADITIGSTVAMNSAGDNMVQLFVLSGYADINGLNVPGGFTIFAEIDENGNIIPGSWTGFRPMTQEELDSFSSLEDLGWSFMNYDIQLPTLAEIQAMQDLYASGGTQGNGDTGEPEGGGGGSTFAGPTEEPRPPRTPEPPLPQLTPESTPEIPA